MRPAPVRPAPNPALLNGGNKIWTNNSIAAKSETPPARPEHQPKAAPRVPPEQQHISTNNRPNLPPNRPKVQPVQAQRLNTQNKQPNKINSGGVPIMGMFTNPGGGPRGKNISVEKTC